jgi:hypothetical protein
VEDPDHRKSAKLRYGLEPVKEAFMQLGDGAEAFLQGLKRCYPRNCGFQARYILRLKERYFAQDIHRAICHATKYCAFDGKSIERILKARAKPRSLESIRNEQAGKFFETLPKIRQRSLTAYCQLLSAKET